MKGKNIYLTHIHKHIHNKTREKDSTITVLISATGHVVVTTTYFYYYIFFAPSCPGSLSGGVTQTFIPEGSGPLVVLSELSCCFPLPQSQEMVVLRDSLMNFLYSRHTFPYLIQWSYFTYFYCHIRLWTTSILFMTENRLFCVFKSGHIKESIPEHTEPIQRTLP